MKLRNLILTTLFALAVQTTCSGQNCTQTDGHFPTDENGLCPSNMKFTSDKNCCICPVNFYMGCDTGEELCTTECLPCTDCGSLHRELKRNCSKDENAICGKCRIGFHEPVRLEEPYSKCEKCQPGNKSPECIKMNMPTVPLTSTKPTARLCETDKDFFPPHWDGQCPSGTEWSNGCCRKCHGCENIPFHWVEDYVVKDIDCDQDLNQFHKHWDGQCPSGTLWNPKSFCCERYYPYDLRPYFPSIFYPDKGNLQADKPKVICKRALNDFRPYENGLCPSGTVLDTDSQCCHGCPDCGPGWKRQPDCIGGCIPCPDRFFSANAKNNLQCFPCTDCALLNREELFECVPVKDTQCGKCLEGYVENEELICVHQMLAMQTSFKATTPVKDQRAEPEECLLPYWDGKCPSGTHFCKDNSCCVPVVHTCRQGYQHTFQRNCLSSCQPCPAGTYSDHPEDNHECKKCTRCELLNRYYMSECLPTADAVCGMCFPSFHKDSSRRHDNSLKCLKCTSPYPRQCEEMIQHLKNLEPITTAVMLTAVTSTNNTVTIILTIIASVSCCAALFFVAVLLYCKCNRCKRGRSGRYGRNDQEQPSTSPAPQDSVTSSPIPKGYAQDIQLTEKHKDETKPFLTPGSKNDAGLEESSNQSEGQEQNVGPTSVQEADKSKQFVGTAEDV